MLGTALYAALVFGLPLGLVSYGLIGLMLERGLITPFANSDDFKTGLATLKKGHKEKKVDNYFIAKWLQFGGGFYGLAALYTYGYIEVKEVFWLVVKLLNPANWTFDIGIDLIVSFFINAITNLVTALVWFSYWPPDMRAVSLIAWVGAGYLGYYFGMRLANAHFGSEVGHMKFWPWWRARRDGWRGGKKPATPKVED